MNTTRGETADEIAGAPGGCRGQTECRVDEIAAGHWLERHNARCELHLAGAAEASGGGGEQWLPGAEQWRRRRTEQADHLWPKVAIARACDVEAVRELAQVGS